MRFEGTVKTWNDERGFGFIEPTQGGQEIFVHIKAYRACGARPQVGQRVTFEVELSPERKKRARDVEAVRAARTKARSTASGPAQSGAASYVAIPAFMLFYLLVAVIWRVPGWVAGLYVGASVVAFFVYAADKSAAVAGGRRVSEATLIFLGLAGGWPGAIVAQQSLRHKSSKASFRSAFWGSVVINVVAFGLLASPLAQQVLRT